MKRRAAVFGLALLSFVLIWGVVARATGRFPQLAEVLKVTVAVATQPDATGVTGLTHLRVTLERVALSVVLTLVGSIIIGTAMATRTSIERPVGNVLPFWLALPGLVVILFSMVLFGFGTFAIVVAVTMLSLPYGTVNIWKGVNDVNANLVEMGEVFGASERSIWRRVYIPGVLPYIFASSRYLLSMIWKITLTAEVFGVETGIGAMVRFWFRLSDIPHLLAYFMMFLLTVFVIEYGMLAPLERRAFAYRAE